MQRVLLYCRPTRMYCIEWPELGQHSSIAAGRLYRWKWSPTRTEIDRLNVYEGRAGAAVSLLQRHKASNCCNDGSRSCSGRCADCRPVICASLLGLCLLDRPLLPSVSCCRSAWRADDVVHYSLLLVLVPFIAVGLLDTATRWSAGELEWTVRGVVWSMHVIVSLCSRH